MPKNVRLFIAFRLLFSARFYYPVFAVMQLDYGLSMQQFAVLNVVWAAAIVILEVPSGVLADRFGRKNMLVAAAILMVLEICVIAFVPLGNSGLVFGAWFFNRILSGAAEAAASGADEALAYDSFAKEDRERCWPVVLDRMTKLASLAFIVAMIVGAAVYDPSTTSALSDMIGLEIAITKEQAMRIPVFLTLASALSAVLVALAMKEPPQESLCTGSCSLWAGVLKAGRWIMGTPVIFAIIMTAVIHDGVISLFRLMASQYYRLIAIPDAAFGVMGAAFAAVGIITSGIARRMVNRFSIRTNFLTISVLVMVGLIGLAPAVPYYGVAVVLFFGAAYTFLNFFSSHYINARVDPGQRATVLSFRGLAINAGFGGLSLTYAALLRSLRSADGSIETSHQAFRDSLYWLPGAFTLMLVPLTLYYFAVMKRRQPE